MTTDEKHDYAEIAEELKSWKGDVLSMTECVNENIDAIIDALTRYAAPEPLIVDHDDNIRPARCVWQPIETCPKDGSEFLSSDGRQIEIIKWSFHKNGIAKGTGYKGMAILNPTHWQPLPQPPEEV